MSPPRRPMKFVIGQMKNEPKKAPPCRIETAFELTLVFCAFVYLKSFSKDVRVRTPPKEPV